MYTYIRITASLRINDIWWASNSPQAVSKAVPSAMHNIVAADDGLHPLIQCSTGWLAPQTNARPFTAVMLLKVSRNTPDKVIDATANANMRGLIVRHSVRHLTCKHIDFLHIGYVVKWWCPGAGLYSSHRHFSALSYQRFRQFRCH